MKNLPSLDELAKWDGSFVKYWIIRDLIRLGRTGIYIITGDRNSKSLTREIAGWQWKPIKGKFYVWDRSLDSGEEIEIRI